MKYVIQCSRFECSFTDSFNKIRFRDLLESHITFYPIVETRNADSRGLLSVSEFVQKI